MRYAIYLTPAAGSALETAASSWLGRSPFALATSAPRAPGAAKAEVPARYGFHATIRAPFRLKPGTTEAELLALFHATYPGTPIAVPLTVTALRHFVALTAEVPALGPLAAAEERALQTFEPLRAPLTEAERARRKPEALDDRARALLDAWGYPHVLERFTFHMTLSGPIEGPNASVVAAAKTHFAPLLHTPQLLHHAVFREDEPGGPFRVLALEGAPFREAAKPREMS